MKRIVISQSMYFPWVGLFEQVKLCDAFVHYDDVQWARGFLNRVQIKTEKGTVWMTVPLRDRHRGQLINEVKVDNQEDWRSQHRNLLSRHCKDTPYFDEMMSVVDAVFDRDIAVLSDVSRASIIETAKYFGLDQDTTFLCSAEFGIPGSGSRRLHDIVEHLSGQIYITGHGAKNYLDHELFEGSDIRVEYMDYQKTPYQQQYGEFTPYVSILDLIANCGKEGAAVIQSLSTNWKEFLNGSH